ncbi:hypothetical protein TR13x_06480 [Caloranaerobacter sp. TR13]|uniref:DUF302 domain-containing protein n=1 Tax=Caloranaerobacter sp. TR13 TaxID=1302151 RepID=UPI0006D459D3|nr:DUF302 domain-containing protein [Caloranaerobacter sp. TR13]KPU27205.1 hypothetical protein TR13x_06480 [Caloranaerobacter sp. TR13]
MDLKYEVKTNKTFDQAINSLKNSLSRVGFGVLWELNFKDKLKEKGLDLAHNFKIFEVCNPKKAKEVLETYLEVGYFLPCKVVVYEKEDSIFIGMLKPTMLMDMIGKADLTNIAKEVEEELKKAIDMAAN